MEDADVTQATNRFISTGSTLVSYDDAGNITVDQKFRLKQYYMQNTSRYGFRMWLFARQNGVKNDFQIHILVWRTYSTMPTLG